jgi:DNA-binding response OmpR family regulator
VINGLRLLVVDPQADAVTLDALTGEGFTVHLAARGTDALVEYGGFAPDALLVSPLLPDLEPADLVAAVRRCGDQPILLGVSGEPDLAPVGKALLQGATGTVERPYVATEVAHRVSTALPHTPSRSPLRLGPLELDPLAHTVHLGEREMTGLGLKEFRLLELLLLRSDRVVSHVELRDALAEGGERAPSSNAIAVHVRRLRSRLTAPLQLRTVRGLGYRLTLDR